MPLPLRRIGSSSSLKIAAGIFVLCLGLQIVNFNSASTASLTSQKACLNGGILNDANASITTSSNTMALSPGELPGYTGWARPERTLAGYFLISSISHSQPRVGEKFAISLRCQGHDDCSNGESLFFVRAYGPSVVAGLVQSNGGGQYVVEIRFLDPGTYTLEVVLNFSNVPSFDEFPLSSDRQQPSYEGYLLPGFPMQVPVQRISEVRSSSTFCSVENLTENSLTGAMSKARWVVTARANGPGYASETLEHPITKAGYKRNIHSLGIHMSYQFVGCQLMTRSAMAKLEGDNHPFHKCGGEEKPQTLQVIFIGDSVMRLQKEQFDGFVKHLPNVQTTFINLAGGFRRCQKFGPDIEAHLKDLQNRRPDDLKAVLFNTGLHDIHRLCGQEWSQDRYDYLDKKKLDSDKFVCLEEYKTLLEEFASIIQAFSADLRVFQSTTAAWPKYGNFGIEWSHGGQSLPLAADTVFRFNEVAIAVLEKYQNDIQVMDGYWITYTRPDNREVGAIGSKLSHPGLEVQGAMGIIWSMMILDKVCEVE